MRAVPTPVIIQAALGVVMVLCPPERHSLVPGVHDGDTQGLHHRICHLVSPAAFQDDLGPACHLKVGITIWQEQQSACQVARTV
jgi:hypothetical protein